MEEAEEETSAALRCQGERRATPNHRVHSSSHTPHLNTISTSATAAQPQASPRSSHKAVAPRSRAVLCSICHRASCPEWPTLQRDSAPGQSPSSLDHTTVTVVTQQPGREVQGCVLLAGSQGFKPILWVCFATASSWTYAQTGLQQDTFISVPSFLPQPGVWVVLRNKKNTP